MISIEEVNTQWLIPSIIAKVRRYCHRDNLANTAWTLTDGNEHPHQGHIAKQLEQLNHTICHSFEFFCSQIFSINGTLDPLTTNIMNNSEGICNRHRYYGYWWIFFRFSWFQDTSLVAVASLCYAGGTVLIPKFVLCLALGYEVVPLPACVSALSLDTPLVWTFLQGIVSYLESFMHCFIVSIWYHRCFKIQSMLVGVKL